MIFLGHMLLLKKANFMFKKEEYQKWTIKEYRANLQKTAPEGEHETLTGKTIRFFSIFLTKILAYTRLTPNIITIISVFIFFSGMSLFIFNSYPLHILGVFLVYLSIVFDATDGEIARLKGNKSGVGDLYTEPVSHDIQYGLMFIPLTLGEYLIHGSIMIVYIGFLGAIFKLLTRFLIIRFEVVKQNTEYNKSTNSNLPSDRYQKKSLVRKTYHFLNRQILSSVGMVFPLLIFVLLDRIDFFIYFYSFGFFLIFSLHFTNQIRYIYSISIKKV